MFEATKGAEVNPPLLVVAVVFCVLCSVTRVKEEEERRNCAAEQFLLLVIYTSSGSSCVLPVFVEARQLPGTWGFVSALRSFATTWTSIILDSVAVRARSRVSVSVLVILLLVGCDSGAG